VKNEGAAAPNIQAMSGTNIEPAKPAASNGEGRTHPAQK
jgi:hypothetical protein